MSMKAFRTNKGCHIHIHPITVTVGTSAHFKCILFTSESVYDKTYTLEGDDYARWGSDDDYIKNWICDKEPYIGRPVPDVDADGNVIIHVTPPTQQDDNKSVHNASDVAKIETLQTQLEIQASKLKSITDLLVGRGLI
jgi:hypothetical protein